MTNDDPNEEAAGHHKVVIRENSRGERDLGYTTGSDPPTSRSPADYGWGTELKTPAFDDVRDVVDLEAHEPGTHVATIHYDLDAWEYTVEFLVETNRGPDSDVTSK